MKGSQEPFNTMQKTDIQAVLISTVLKYIVMRNHI